MRDETNNNTHLEQAQAARKKEDEATQAAIISAIAAGKENLIDDVIKQLLTEEKRSNLVAFIEQIIAHDFEQNAQGETALKASSAQRLGLFSLGIINAASCSFLGLPAAAILVGLDHLLTNPMAAGALTGPDKILLILIALIILTIFIKLAYKQSYSSDKKESEYLKRVHDTFAQYLCKYPNKDTTQEILNSAIYDKYLAKLICDIRKGEYSAAGSNTQLIAAEIAFNKTATLGSFPIPKDNNQPKIDSAMRYLNYTTAFAVIFLTSYFTTVAATASILAVIHFIPIVCTILLAQQAIKYAVNDYYKPKAYPTEKDKCYLALYKVMKKYRESNSQAAKEYIKKVTKEQNIQEAISAYIDAYPKDITTQNKKNLQKINDNYITSIYNKYQKRFYKIGAVLGTANAVLNGILCISLGIIGIVAILTVFFPTVHLSVLIAVFISVGLFLGGTMHSFRFTRKFITDIFSNFGKTIDEIKNSHEELTTKEWINILMQKAVDNRKAITIAFFASITLSVLGFVAISHFLIASHVSLPLTILILTVTTFLNFIASSAVFSRTIQSTDEMAQYEENLRAAVAEDSRREINKITSRINKHYILSAIITLLVFSICLSPPLSFTVVPAILISFAALVTLLVASAIIDFNKIQQHQQSRLNVISLRLRLCLIILFGLAFGIAAGPAVASLAFSIIPTTILPIPAILTLSTLIGVTVGTSLCYIYALVYWNAAIKPEAPNVDWDHIQKVFAPKESSTTTHNLTSSSGNAAHPTTVDTTPKRTTNSPAEEDSGPESGPSNS